MSEKPQTAPSKADSRSVALRYRERAVDLGSAIREFSEPIFANRLRKFALFVFVVYILIAIFASLFPLPGPYETLRVNGDALLDHPPTAAAPFGTTAFGYSVLSQTLMSFRTSMIAGSVAALTVILVGMNIGLISGYYGGKVETLLMGLTDFAYGLPVYPFAIIVMVIAGRGAVNIGLVIGLVLWRTIARVTRGEVLTLREREFIKSARASGTSDPKIIYFHILPNLIPLVVVYFVQGIIWGIFLEAGLSFIGLGDPNAISWGVMLHNAFSTGKFATSPWWVIPPALALAVFIWSLFTIARALEENIETGSADAMN